MPDQSEQSSIDALSDQLGQQLLARGLSLCTVESCTGGGVAQAVTRIAGSSSWYDRGFVTYSNQAKIDQVGVDANLIRTFGAVSEQVALAMATGGLAHSQADIAVSITGIAGPGGATADKPLGLVYFGFADKYSTAVQHQIFGGDREQVRHSAILFALNQLIIRISK